MACAQLLSTCKCSGWNNWRSLPSRCVFMQPLRRASKSIEHNSDGCPASSTPRSVGTSAAKVAQATAAAASSAAAASAAVVVSSQSVNLVVAATMYAVVCLITMLLFGKTQRIRELVTSYWMFVPLSLLYIVLLIQSWTPNTLSLMLPGSLEAGLSGGFKPQFLPQIENIMTLFSSSLTAASFYVHIVTINLFLSRLIFIDGLKRRIPTFHTLIISFLCGPLGYLCHFVTWGALLACEKVLGTNLRYKEQPIVLKSASGTITILPAVDA